MHYVYEKTAEINAAFEAAGLKEMQLQCDPQTRHCSVAIGEAQSVTLDKAFLDQLAEGLSQVSEDQVIISQAVYAEIDQKREELAWPNATHTDRADKGGKGDSARIA